MPGDARCGSVHWARNCSSGCTDSSGDTFVRSAVPWRCSVALSNDLRSRQYAAPEARPGSRRDCRED